MLLAVTLWSAPTVAEASFNQQAASAQSASSALLHPPTGLSVSRSACNITLTWTATVDARATGYHVYNGATLLQTVTPKSATSKAFAITKNTNYTLTMVTYYLNWSSSTSQAVAISC
ncbi:hypothetical protein [Jatrophihabitans sp.]|uniref:hypothetical protein n=1 Tax=Jatrophihabitans sp. TaxID=1932789 RepID=UPI002EDEB0A2